MEVDGKPNVNKDEKIRNRGIEKEMRTKYRREEIKKYGGLKVTPRREMENRETGAPNRAEKKEESDKKQNIKKCHSTKRKTPRETCLKGILVVNWNVHWGGWWKGDGRAQGVKFAAAAASLQHRQIPNNEEPQRESHRQIIHKALEN